MLDEENIKWIIPTSQDNTSILFQKDPVSDLNANILLLPPEQLSLFVWKMFVYLKILFDILNEYDSQGSKSKIFRKS